MKLPELQVFATREEVFLVLAKGEPLVVYAVIPKDGGDRNWGYAERLDIAKTIVRQVNSEKEADNEQNP